MQLAQAAAIDNSDTADTSYKALVCVFLFGGNDSFNMLIPAETDEYKVYKKSRSNLALNIDSSQNNAALVLNKSTSSNRSYAVHPALKELKHLYDSEKLAFVANVGTLVEPTSISQYKKKSVILPRALFSHNDQRDHWQTGIPQDASATGWLGRAADLISSESPNPFSSISLSGNNTIQNGRSSLAYSINANGSIGIKSNKAREFLQGISPTDSTRYSNFLTQALSTIYSDSMQRHEKFSIAFENTNSLTNNFSYISPLSKKLKTIARTISARNSLGLTRQTFFVFVPGWDNHQELLETHDLLLADLSKSLYEFNSLLESMNISKQVTTFTASDFGRTLRSNGRGTDHAWGGNQIIMGGAVRGGDVHGLYPDALLLADGLDVGKNGRIIPTTSCDEYFAELLLWFGIDRSNLHLALPNIHNFIDRQGGPTPLDLFS